MRTWWERGTTSSRWTLTGGFGLFLALTLVWLAPLLPHFGGAVIEWQGDGSQALRAYWAIDEAGKTPFTWSRDTMSGAPEGIPRPTAPDILSPTQSSFVWTVKPLVGRVAALNLFILLGITLTAFSLFALLLRFGFGLLAAVFGGFVVGFNPWLLERAYQGHAAFLHGWVFVLLLFVLVRLSERRTVRWAAAAGAAYGLTFTVAAYFGLIASAIVVAFIVVELVRGASPVERLRTLGLFGVAGAVTSLFLLPAAIVFFTTRATVSRALNNPLDQLDQLGASLVSYVVPSPRHPVLGDLAAEIRGDPAQEKVLFFGLVTLVLAVAGTILIRRSDSSARRLLVLALATAPVALLSSLPRTFSVFGQEIPTLAALISEVTSFYRVYARFGFVFGIAVTILAAWTVSRLSRTVYGRVVAFAALGLVAFELNTGTMTIFRVDRPADYQVWLGEQPRGIVAHYPMPMDKLPALELAHTQITFQPYSRQPLYAIFSAGTGGTREDAIRILTRRAQNPNTPGILAAEHVRYVVLHDDVYREQGERVPTLGTPWLRRAYRPIRRFGDVRVFELQAKPSDADAALARYGEAIARVQGLLPVSLEFTELGFNDAEEFQSGELWRWMTQAGQLQVHNPNAAPARFVLKGLSFSNKVPRRVELTTEDAEVLAAADVPPHMVPFELGPFTLPEGDSLLSLRVSPKPQPLVDPGNPDQSDKRVGSIYLSPLRIATLPDYSNTLRSG